MNIKTITFIEDGFNLGNALKEIHISQRKFAERIGIHWTVINRICNGLATDKHTAEKIYKEIYKIKGPTME